MKFLHLSDLHIGKTVNGFSMIGEQRNVLTQVIGCVQSKRPDAVVIAGDVYDRAVPGIDAVKLFDDFLTELAGENVAVMVISGNHDSPERLSFAGRLLSGKRLFLRGTFDGCPEKVTLADQWGDVNFWLLPFIKPASVRALSGAREAETYDEALAAVIGAAEIDYGGRNVLVSHQFYTGGGSKPTRSESEMNPVGGLDAVNSELLLKFDYAALGHLHGEQRAGAEHIRYAGSPLKYSFSEIRQKKSLLFVELGEKGSVTAEQVPLFPLHDMREIKGEIETLTGDGAPLPAEREDYLRVILTDEREIIDPMGKIRSVYPNVMSLDFENSRTKINPPEINPDSERTEALPPYELFLEFFLDINGCTMNPEQAKIARELLETGGAD